MDEPHQPEGTIAFSIEDVVEGWRTDRQRHQLPPVEAGGFQVTVTKTERGFLEVSLYGLLPAAVTLEAAVPQGSRPIYIMLIWRKEAIQLFLNGEPVQLTPLPTGNATVRRTDN